MKKFIFLLALTLGVVVGCSSSGDDEILTPEEFILDVLSKVETDFLSNTNLVTVDTSRYPWEVGIFLLQEGGETYNVIFYVEYLPEIEESEWGNYHITRYYLEYPPIYLPKQFTGNGNEELFHQYIYSLESPEFPDITPYG